MKRDLAILALVVALGILSRTRPLGWYPYDKSLGDVLYAAAVYLVLALLPPRKSPWVLASLALGLCVAVEVFKLTGIPGRYAAWGVSRWVLGTTFAWHNLGCYALGVGVMLSLERVWPRHQ